MGSNQVFDMYASSCPNVKTRIHWYDLYEGHYVVLDKNFQKKLFETAVKKAGNFSKLGAELGIGRKTISYCSTCLKNPQIKTLISVVKYINFPLSNVNRKIINLGKIRYFKPTLPFNLHCSDGAEIRAAFLSDGHIDKSPTAGPQYCAREKELHERLVIICKRVFGEFNTKTNFGHKTYITRFPAAIGRALELSGVPRGDKRLRNCYVPKDILFGNNTIRSGYLRRAFDDEGNVCINLKHNKRSIKLSRSTDISEKIKEAEIAGAGRRVLLLPDNIKHNLLEGERLLLWKLGIKAGTYFESVYRSKTGRVTAKWNLVLTQQDQLRKFAKLINFTLNYKKEKLTKVLVSYKYRKLPNGEGKKHALAVMQKFYDQKGYFKYGDLGRELVKTGRSFDLASRYVKHYKNNGTIVKIKYGTYSFKKDHRN